MSFKQKIGLIAFGIFLSFILLEIGLRIGGSLFLFVQERRNTVSLGQKGTYRIMCVGDSMTGLGGRESYPRQLENILNRRFNGRIIFSVINKGIPGASPEIVVARLQDSIDRYNPDMVIAMMGINSGEGIPWHDQDTDRDVSKVSQFIKSLRIYKLAGILLQQHIKQSHENDAEYKEQAHRRTYMTEQDSGQELLELGTRAYIEGNYVKAIQMFKQAIILNSDADDVYVELGNVYHLRGQFEEAEPMWRQAIEINPNNKEAYGRLAFLYSDQGKHEEAEAALQKVIEIDLGNDLAYFELAELFHSQGRIDEAEVLYKKAVEINASSQMEHAGLMDFYIRQQEQGKAEAMLKDGIERAPDSVGLYSLLGSLYRMQGKDKLAIENFEKAKHLRSQKYNPWTLYYYRRLKDIVSENGAKLVCVQYPLRDIELLKRMFDAHEDIIYVDNGKVFERALKRASYHEYFVDTYGGNFGHCTSLGNQLLAENISNTIVKNLFNE